MYALTLGSDFSSRSDDMELGIPRASPAASSFLPIFPFPADLGIYSYICIVLGITPGGHQPAGFFTTVHIIAEREFVRQAKFRPFLFHICGKHPKIISLQNIYIAVGEKAHNNRLQFGLIEKGTAK